MAPRVRYRRVLLKLSGETLGGDSPIDPKAVGFIVGELGKVARLGVRIGLVIGGGNLLRGRDLEGNRGIGRVSADYMGMLATVINGIALRDALMSAGVPACLLSAIADERICEPYSVQSARERLDDGQIVILAGGTGSPFFTTDTCAALRACELGADVLLKATTVDGVYSADPKKSPSAKRYSRLTYAKVLADRLGVMDLTAISLCMDNRLPVLVFAGGKSGNLPAAVQGRSVGTLIG